MVLLQICASSNGIYGRSGDSDVHLMHTVQIFVCAVSILNNSLVYAENIHRASGPEQKPLQHLFFDNCSFGSNFCSFLLV